MKTFKLIDFWVQVALFTGGLMFCLFFPTPDRILIAYFSTGGWQLISSLIHLLFTKKYFAVNDRKYYLLAVLVVFVSALLIFIAPILYGFLLLLTTPLLAIWYISICYAENKMLRHKSLVHLK